MHAAVPYGVLMFSHHLAPTSAHVFVGCCSCARSTPQSLCVRRNAAMSLLTVASVKQCQAATSVLFGL